MRAAGWSLAAGPGGERGRRSGAGGAAAAVGSSGGPRRGGGGSEGSPCPVVDGSMRRFDSCSGSLIAVSSKLRHQKQWRMNILKTAVNGVFMWKKKKAIQFPWRRNLKLYPQASQLL